MANGTYGTIKPSIITYKDVDIFYHNRPTRNSDSVDFYEYQKLDSKYLTDVNWKNEGERSELLPGMYNLKLPLNIFNQKGFYTIYIKPKEISCKISDVSVLASYPDVRGIVINTNDIDDEYESLFVNGALVGYRIEYFDNSERQDFYRIITSSNKCEPINYNLNDVYSKSVKYRYNDTSDLLFLTVTPSSSTSFKSNVLPFIGKTNQEIRLINTKFNPVVLEVEMVEHDIETVSTMLEGSQLRNLTTGTITTYTNEGEIYHQSEYGTKKDSYSGSPLYDYRKNKMDDIDFTQNSEIIEE